MILKIFPKAGNDMYIGEIRPMTLIIFAFSAKKIQNYLRMYRKY